MTSATGVESTLRGEIRRALDAMDAAGFDRLAAWAGFNDHVEVFERVAREEIDRSAEDVKQYWNSPCNGSLN